MLGNIEFAVAEPALTPCVKGVNIGLPGAECFVKILYTGKSNPGQGEFIAEFWFTAEETGGGGIDQDTARASLFAKE